jgi:7,8-dihydropterin-6-yl-methyl-4-(beta-D-ribofuranosyl)aminobenzene 5'-phosphate synthase
MTAENRLIVTTVYDNNLDRSELLDDLGFSCIVQHPKGNIIFHTGAKHQILENNLKKLNIDPASIDYLVVSHKHWGRGSLLVIGAKSKHQRLCSKNAVQSFRKKFTYPRKKIHSIKNHHRINDTFHLIISKNFWINELVLGIKTSKGMIAVTGCSHTGILNIERLIQYAMNEKIHVLLGAFHFLRSLKSNIKNTVIGLKNQNIDFIAPCHCTGDRDLELFKKRI